MRENSERSDGLDKKNTKFNFEQVKEMNPKLEDQKNDLMNQIEKFTLLLQEENTQIEEKEEAWHTRCIWQREKTYEAYKSPTGSGEVEGRTWEPVTEHKAYIETTNDMINKMKKREKLKKDE